MQFYSALLHEGFVVQGDHILRLCEACASALAQQQTDNESPPR
jgi:hypothetical protein